MVLVSGEHRYKTRYVYANNQKDVLTPASDRTSAKCPHSMAQVPIRKLFADALSCSRKPGARAMLRRYKRAVQCVKLRLKEGRRHHPRGKWYNNPQEDGHAFAIGLAMHHAAVCRLMLKHMY